MLVPIDPIEIHCEDMELQYKIAGVPPLKHLRMREDGKDVLLYEALSRAIWGSENFCCLLGVKVQQELEEHGAWYRARVGVGFFGCATGLWPTACEATMSR